MPRLSRWLQLTRRQEHVLKRALLQKAYSVGPSVALVVQALWSDAVVEMARDVSQLLRLPHRYGAERMDAACRRAAYYRQDRNCFTIEWILQEGYDELPLTPYTDIRGNFVFELNDLGDEQSCYPRPINPGVAGLGARGLKYRAVPKSVQNPAGLM